jgi:hypothetical protein
MTTYSQRTFQVLQQNSGTSYQSNDKKAGIQLSFSRTFWIAINYGWQRAFERAN